MPMPCIDDEVLDGTRTTKAFFNESPSYPASWPNDLYQRWAYDVNAFIGHELTLVPEVENVFVSEEDNEGKVLRVTVVVDARDPDVRAAIYKREQAIMDELKNLDFDFHIIAREGRPLDVLITDAGAGDSAL
jgi:hypothetical protein